MRSKGKIFTRHGTTDIGLNIVNAKANTYNDLKAKSANVSYANNNHEVRVAQAA